MAIIYLPYLMIVTNGVNRKWGKYNAVVFSFGNYFHFSFHYIYFIYFSNYQ